MGRVAELGSLGRNEIAAVEFNTPKRWQQKPTATMKTQHLLLFLCIATVLGAHAAAPATEPAIVALRFVLAADAFTAIQQKLGAKAAAAVSRVDEKRNTVALDSAHPQAAVVRAFLTGLDHQPPARPR